MSPLSLLRRCPPTRSVCVPPRRAGRSVHLLLALVVSAGFLCGGGGAAAGGGPADSVFSVDFFGRAINFTLAPDFSAHAIAERWCAEQGLGAGEHVRAVREVVEGAVADALTDRIEAGMLGKDSEARWFLESVCRDFPSLHRMKIALEVRQEPLRIIDAFPFFNELEVLEVRLAELYPIVDKFILVESSVTHAGNPKDLFFDANLAAFDQYRDKIIHVVLDSLPESPDAWVRERAQRDGIHEGLEQAAIEDQDLVLVSDADEIPRRSTMRALAWCSGFRPPLQLKSAFYYYSFRHRWTEDGPDGSAQPHQWRHPRAVTSGQLAPPRVTVNHLRYDPGQGNMQEIDDAAWHLSYFGGAERIRTKIEAYGHQENNLEEFKDLEHIRAAITRGEDVFGRGAVHGDLRENTEPLDLPWSILARAARGDPSVGEWLPPHPWLHRAEPPGAGVGAGVQHGEL